MSHVPHELAEEFPDAISVMHDLKMQNAHFSNLASEYHAINRELHRIETGVEPAAEQHEQELRKKRMLLKDKIAHMIAEA